MARVTVKVLHTIHTAYNKKYLELISNLEFASRDISKTVRYCDDEKTANTISTQRDELLEKTAVLQKEMEQCNMLLGAFNSAFEKDNTRKIQALTVDMHRQLLENTKLMYEIENDYRELMSLYNAYKKEGVLVD